MNKPLTAIATCCCALIAISVGAAQGPACQNGDPEDSWAEQREDGGLELSIKISPQTMNLDSEADVDWVTVHTDIAYSLVVADTVALSGIPAAYTFADDRGNLVAKFSMARMLEIVEPPAAELTLTGMTKDDILFEGSDIVRVLDPLA